MNNRLKLVAFFTLLLALAGCGKRPSENKLTIGTHTLTIVDTSRKGPFGGTGGTRNDDVAGTTTKYYDTADGRYKITLVNNVLTINGVKYTMKNPKSEIRIVDGRIEIDGVEAVPDTKP